MNRSFHWPVGFKFGGFTFKITLITALMIFFSERIFASSTSGAEKRPETVSQRKSEIELKNKTVASVKLRKPDNVSTSERESQPKISTKSRKNTSNFSVLAHSTFQKMSGPERSRYAQAAMSILGSLELNPKKGFCVAGGRVVLTRRPGASFCGLNSSQCNEETVPCAKIFGDTKCVSKTSREGETPTVACLAQTTDQSQGKDLDNNHLASAGNTKAQTKTKTGDFVNGVKLNSQLGDQMALEFFKPSWYLIQAALRTECRSAVAKSSSNISNGLRLAAKNPAMTTATKNLFAPPLKAVAHPIAASCKDIKSIAETAQPSTRLERWFHLPPRMDGGRFGKSALLQRYKTDHLRTWLSALFEGSIARAENTNQCSIVDSTFFSPTGAKVDLNFHLHADPLAIEEFMLGLQRAIDPDERASDIRELVGEFLEKNKAAIPQALGVYKKTYAGLEKNKFSWLGVESYTKEIVVGSLLDNLASTVDSYRSMLKEAEVSDGDIETTLMLMTSPDFYAAMKLRAANASLKLVGIEDDESVTKGRALLKNLGSVEDDMFRYCKNTPASASACNMIFDLQKESYPASLTEPLEKFDEATLAGMDPKFVVLALNYLKAMREMILVNQVREASMAKKIGAQKDNGAVAIGIFHKKAIEKALLESCKQSGSTSASESGAPANGPSNNPSAVKQ
jgi:hypothetical protein